MGHVLSALAPALIHHPEPSSVSFRWRHPKQGALITAAPLFGQVASHPPDIYTGSGGWECTQCRPPAPWDSFAHQICSSSTTSHWYSFNRSAKLFQEFSWSKGERPFWSIVTNGGDTQANMHTCRCIYKHIHTNTCWSRMQNSSVGLCGVNMFQYICPLAVVTLGHRLPPILISNGKWVIALVEDEGENGLSGSFVSAG